MAKIFLPQSRFQGLSYSEKEGLKSSYLWARSVDYRSDPTKLKILPKTAKVSGSTVVDLIMDGDRQGTDTYLYGDAGNIYKRTSADSWSNLQTVASSSGNGMKYFGEDSYLYYTSDKVIGRYGPFGGTQTFANDFLGAQGGIPLNTHSLDLESGSSQYATAADSASLSITGDISLECYRKFESLPTVGNSMVFMSKWNADTALRSYLFELYAISGYFGDGDSGALTISADTTQAPVDSACTGTAAAYTLSATNASFAVGDKILIHQSQGSGAGTWERNVIAGYTAGTITLTTALSNSYISGAQVVVLEEYTNVTVNTGITWTAKAWDGTVGGILCFLASGTVTISGTINASGKGFRGGTGVAAATANQGEGTAGGGVQTTSANGNGGGGGTSSEGAGQYSNGGGGGGHAAAGTAGSVSGGGGTAGAAGGTTGTADLTTLTFGGGGGGGGRGSGVTGTPGTGGNGGGIVFIIGVTIADITGAVLARGIDGAGATGEGAGGGGGGAGSVLLKAQVATLGTTKISGTAGAGQDVTANGGDGGAGGIGRIHLDYYTSYTGTTSPTLDVIQDNTLVTTTSYQLRLGVSSTGTNEEFLTKTLTVDPVVGTWYRYAVTWVASTSVATFYLAGVSLGTSTGTLTAIHNNVTLFAIGAKFTTGTAGSFFDGKVDDDRIFNDIRTASELFTNMDTEIGTATANLQGYWQVDNSVSDSTANANNLTLVNTPVYSTDVPFSSATARLDLDQSLDTSGQTETLPTAIDEGTTNRQTFVPAKDPQKSIEVNISVVGTGDWTLTVHDALNRTIVSKTVTNANLNAGDFEFIFASVWRPVIGASYHFHITSTVTDGVVVTTTLNDLETVDYHSYYQFLVEDDHHPVEQIVNKLGIGNERYLATWDGITYSPMAVVLPSGYRIRCLGTWREYLVMGTMRGTNISDYDQGRLFFWDGIHTTYNFYVDVPEGGINCILSGDPLYFMAGYSGDFMTYAGGGAEKIRRMPKIVTADTLEFNRKAIAMWRALVHIGMAENSTSTTIERGVFSWGTLHKELSPTMSFDYPLSLGITTGATLEIGMVFPIGSELLISWRNATSYGVDKVSPSNAPFATATCEFLISDADKIWAEKQAQFLRGYFKALVSGDSVTLKYKIDRNSSFVSGTAVTTADKKEARLPLPTKANRFNEFEYAVDLATTNSTSPEFYGIALEVDDLQHERRT